MTDINDSGPEGKENDQEVIGDQKSKLNTSSVPSPDWYMALLSKYWKFSLGLGISSAAVGAFLGNGAETELYIAWTEIGKDAYKGLGWIFGAIAGLLVGIGYVPVLARRFENKKPEKGIARYGILTGMLAGVICSTILHTSLSIAYKNLSLVGLIVGAIFGIVAGTILGWISSKMMNR